MTIYHFYYYDGVGYSHGTIEATDDEEAGYGAFALGYKVVTGVYTSKAEADEEIYCKIHDC